MPKAAEDKSQSPDHCQARDKIFTYYVSAPEPKVKQPQGLLFQETRQRTMEKTSELSSRHEEIIYYLNLTSNQSAHTLTWNC